MSRRFQFSLKWMFLAMLGVAAFFGGMALQRRLDKPTTISGPAWSNMSVMVPEIIELPDGTRWYRFEETK